MTVNIFYAISFIVLFGLCSSRCPRDQEFHFSNNSTVGFPAECSIPPSCDHWFDAGVNESGVYPVKPDEGEAFQVYCDMATEGGGWTVFQRRSEGTLDFYRPWSDYKHGFGDLAGEFWLGLDNIHRLTADEINNVLRVDMREFYGRARYAEYSVFNIGDESAEYILTVGGYSGDAGDSLSYHNGRKFSTRNNDNDDSRWTNCAASRRGGWWYNNCEHSNLNGYYYHYCTSSSQGMRWVHASSYNMLFTEIKTRLR